MLARHCTDMSEIVQFTFQSLLSVENKNIKAYSHPVNL